MQTIFAFLYFFFFFQILLSIPLFSEDFNDLGNCNKFQLVKSYLLTFNKLKIHIEEKKKLLQQKETRKKYFMYNLNLKNAIYKPG